MDKHEPVAYVTDSGKSAYILLGVDLEDDTPLYLAPPQKEWVGLTDDDIWEAFKQYDTMQYVAFSKAIEAKLREKNS